MTADVGSQSQVAFAELCPDAVPTRAGVGEAVKEDQRRRAPIQLRRQLPLPWCVARLQAVTV